jgi:hypothetical protein
MSDGLIDFMVAVSGYEQIDAYPAERISRGEGEIITAHARKDSRGAFVFGDVGKRYGAAWVTTAWSHVDVIVLDPKSRHLKSLATRFFPSTVPETQRGIRGHSSYFVRLPSLPPAGSTIVVALRGSPSMIAFRAPTIRRLYSTIRAVGRTLRSINVFPAL